MIDGHLEVEVAIQSHTHTLQAVCLKASEKEMRFSLLFAFSVFLMLAMPWTKCATTAAPDLTADEINKLDTKAVDVVVYIEEDPLFCLTNASAMELTFGLWSHQIKINTDSDIGGILGLPNSKRNEAFSESERNEPAERMRMNLVDEIVQNVKNLNAVRLTLINGLEDFVSWDGRLIYDAAFPKSDAELFARFARIRRKNSAKCKLSAWQEAAEKARGKDEKLRPEMLQLRFQLHDYCTQNRREKVATPILTAFLDQIGVITDDTRMMEATLCADVPAYPKRRISMSNLLQLADQIDESGRSTIFVLLPGMNLDAMGEFDKATSAADRRRIHSNFGRSRPFQDVVLLSQMISDTNQNLRLLFGLSIKWQPWEMTPKPSDADQSYSGNTNIAWKILENLERLAGVDRRTQSPWDVFYDKPFDDLHSESRSLNKLPQAVSDAVERMQSSVPLNPHNAHWEKLSRQRHSKEIRHCECSTTADDAECAGSAATAACVKLSCDSDDDFDLFNGEPCAHERRIRQREGAADDEAVAATTTKAADDADDETSKASTGSNAAEKAQASEER